ncbi:hypothetical protein HPP92_012496 [Vanilla planifolia]|uniref:Late embryogenesis abundant protein n=1 Tax=Vanilla planifolia TaxID=51239 RepID=A0A835R854_VANPL|nr:hypothetical protein HPP92_012496 [Vanilla planifolia]
MESKQQKPSTAAEKKEEEELPLESSPYVKSSDVEEYKEKGYGTHGHQQPVDNSRTGGATDGPTLSGGGLTQDQVKTADAMNRCGAV